MIKLSISKGNVKMGDIPSVSLMPVVTCRRNAPCKKGCYACRMCRYPSVKNAWQRNTDLYNSDPDSYFMQLNDALYMNRFFRVHVAGDIPAADYFNRLVDIVRNNPHCKVLMFTKQFEIINAYITDGGIIPDNFRIIFSNWFGWECDNPYNFPVTDVIDPGAEIPTGCHLCGGNCAACAAACAGCWTLEKGEKLVFYKH